MTDPVIVRIARPYDTVEDYLAAEADTIDHRGMLLIGAEPLPEGTLVRFSVTLNEGEPVIKAEGRSRRYRPARDGRLGGLQVQFKRFGASTKAFIDAAVERHPASATDPDDEDASLGAAAPARAEASTPLAAEPPLATDRDDPSRTRAAPAPGRPINAPGDREQLLERLRHRARGLPPARIAELTRRAR